MTANELIRRLQEYVRENGNLPVKVSVRGPLHDIETVSLTGRFSKNISVKENYTLWIKNSSDYKIVPR